MSLAEKMSRVAAKVGFAEFDAKNDFHKYSYASAASIIRMVNKALTEEGVALGTASELLRYEDTEKGPRALVRLTLRFTDGAETLEAQGIGEGKDTGDKACAKANTSAYKYALAHAFCMAWGAEDPEADSSTDAPKAAKPSKPAKAPKEAPKQDTSDIVAKLRKAIEDASAASDLDKVRDGMLKRLETGSKEFDELKQLVIKRRKEIG